MCWPALCSTEDLDTIEREIGLRAKRQLIERFLDYGGVMVSTSSTAFSSRRLAGYG